MPRHKPLASQVTKSSSRREEALTKRRVFHERTTKAHESARMDSKPGGSNAWIAVRSWIECTDPAGSQSLLTSAATKAFRARRRRCMRSGQPVRRRTRRPPASSNLRRLSQILPGGFLTHLVPHQIFRQGCLPFPAFESGIVSPCRFKKLCKSRSVTILESFNPTNILPSFGSASTITGLLSPSESLRPGK